MNDWYFTFTRLGDQVHTGFALLTPVLIVLARVWKTRRRLFYHFMLSSNILLLITAICQIIAGIWVFLRFRFFPIAPPPVDGNFIYIFMLTAYLLLPLLFCWRSFRNSYRITLLVSLLLLSARVTEHIATISGTLYQQHIPPSATYYWPDSLPILLTLISYMVATTIVSLFIKE